MSRLAMIANTLLYLGPCVWLYFVIFRGRVRRVRLFWPLAALLALATLAVTLFMYSPLNPFRNWALAYSVIYMTAVLLLCRLMTDRPVPQILFVLLFLGCYSDDIDLVTTALAPALPCAVPAANSYLAAHCAATAVTLPLLWWFCVRVLRPRLCAEPIMPYWRMLWIVPATFYLIYRLNTNAVIWTPGCVLTLRDGLWRVAWIAGTFLCHYVILRMLTETARNAELLERLHRSDLQLSLQKEQYRLLRDSIESTRRAHHDLRHHMLVLKRCLEQRDLARMTEYLNQFLETLRSGERVPACENYAVDAIAQHYVGLARESGAEVTLALDLPAELPIAENDVCVVMGNLLENAAEACRRQDAPPRFLWAKAALVGEGSIAVRVRNSYSGEIRCADGVFRSSKRDGEGVGIESVRNMAARHGGVARFSYGDGVFEASVLLNIRPGAKNKSLLPCKSGKDTV